MSAPVDTLKKWFENLKPSEQQDVLKFVYGRTLVRKGMYMGPNPSLIDEGLYVGPAPASSSSVCPSCGRPL